MVRGGHDLCGSLYIATDDVSIFKVIRSIKLNPVKVKILEDLHFNP